MAIPLCPYFNKCGGCAAQHIDYDIQLENKQKAVENAIGHKVTVHSANPYRYRNRMDFIFTSRGIGFRERNNWKSIVDVDECVISEPIINTLVKEIGEYFGNIDAYNVRTQQGTYMYAVIRTAKNESAISFVLNEDSKGLGQTIDAIKKFAVTSSATNIAVTYVPSTANESISDEFFMVKGKDTLTAEYCGKTFSFSLQGFFQNNHVMAQQMHEYVANIITKHETKQSHLLDLYGGVGCFGIINADKFKDVTIVESVKSCIDAAQKNIAQNKITNAKALVLDAKSLKKVQLAQPLFVITDPPRSGMDPATITQLNVLKPEVIVYISCNYHQLAKDLTKFKNYEVKSAALFDLFPQTNHAEVVAELVKKN